MQTTLDIPPHPRCPFQRASYLHYLHVEQPSMEESDPSRGARASLVLVHLQSQLFPHVFPPAPGRAAGLGRWDGTHGLGSALLHFPNLLRVPHCGKRKPMRNILLCQLAGSKKHRSVHVLVGDELFRSKDRLPVIKQETKISVSTEEKAKKGNLNPVLCFKIHKAFRSIASFFCQSPPATLQNKNSHQ